jgi:signal transduction histidine kinase
MSIAALDAGRASRRSTLVRRYIGCLFVLPASRTLAIVGLALLAAGTFTVMAGGAATWTRAGALLLPGLVYAGACFAVRERLRTSERALVVRMLRQVQLEYGLSGTIEALGDELLREFGAAELWIAAEEMPTGRAFLWTVRRDESDVNAVVTSRSAIGPSERSGYFFEAPAAWRAARRRSGDGSQLDVLAIDAGHRNARRVPAAFIPAGFREAHDSESCVATSFAFGREWSCRLFVLGASARGRAVGELHLLRTLVNEVAPAVHNVFLLHRLQSRAAEIERANLARGLHDGLIQSLIGAEMRVHVARRRAGDSLPQVEAELSQIEEILHQEVLNVRDLMQRIKPIRVEPADLLDFLAEDIDKFERDTGITARFLADVRHVSLSPSTCAQVARIVQEALCNVRKHSGARSVDVRLVEGPDSWSLVVEDDGRGMRGITAADRLTERVSGRRAFRLPSPAVIKECARSIGGDLQVLPASGGGLRLEIAIPRPGARQAGTVAPFRSMPGDAPLQKVRLKSARAAQPMTGAGVGDRSGSRGIVARLRREMSH